MKLTVALGELDRYAKKHIASIQNEFPGIGIEIRGSNERDFAETDVLLARSLSDAELDSALNLRAVFVPYTGLNRFPVQKLHERGVVVVNSHGRAAAVAERALTLALSVMGRVVEMHTAMQREGVWLTRRRWGEEYWHSLHDKRCGIYGLGAIGGHLVKLLRPFGVKIIALERDRNKGLADAYVPDIASMAESCDVLFVCVPLSEHTRGSIDREVLAKMHSKFIVNIARGEIIEEEALYWSLSQGVLAGAGLDVWYQYPEMGSYEPTFPSSYPIHELRNVVMSPHAASHAIEFRDGYYREIFEHLAVYLREGACPGAVDLGKYLL